MPTPRQRTLLLRPTATAFSPTSLANLWAWWDVATISTLFQDSAGTTPVASNADPIGYIADRSGNGRFVRQTGATSTRPTYTTAVQNGLPAASFDGGDYLDSVATVDSFPLTIVGVMRRSTTVGATHGIVTLYHSTLGGSYCLIASGNDFRAGIGLPAAVSFGSTTVANTPYLFGGVFGATSVANILNNAISTGTAHTATVRANIVRIAGRNANDVSLLLNGFICEICIYNRALSNIETGQLQTYFNSKWSVY